MKRSSVKILFLLAFCLFVCGGNISFADITFDAYGKWESSFGTTPITQISAAWDDGTGLPDGIEQSTEHLFRRVVLSDEANAGEDHWTAAGTANEWYYNHSNLAVEHDIGTNEFKNGGVRNLTVGGITQWQVFTNYKVGSLTSGVNNTGQRAWAYNATLGYDTLYIYSTVDPDDLPGQTIAWIYHESNPWYATIDTHSSYMAGDYYSELTADANNPAGVKGSMGFRAKEGDGNTMDTGRLGINFSEPQKEIWFRYYVRWEAGRQFAQPYTGSTGGLNDKQFFLFGVSGASLAYPLEGKSYNNYTILSQGSTQHSRVGTDIGFADLTETFTVDGRPFADGSWRCFEIYYKHDTASGVGIESNNDGVGRIWIDGKLKAELTDMDWTTGRDGDKLGVAELRRQGIKAIAFSANQAWIQSNEAKSIDMDDLVIYTKTPPNKDVHGNSFIGPIHKP